MKFNSRKCQILSVTRKKCPIKFQYNLHNEALENVKSAKYLGIQAGITTVTSKANKALGFVKRNIHSSSKFVKTRAYQAIVRPSFEYASCLWDPHTHTAKQKLEAVQRRAARYVTRRYHNTSSVTNMLHHLEWQTLEQRRIATNLTMLYKITNNIVTVPTHTYLTPGHDPPHVHTTFAACHTNVTQILSNIASLHAPSSYGTHCHLTKHLHPPLTCSRTQCLPGQTPPQQLQSNTAQMYTSTFSYTLVWTHHCIITCGGSSPCPIIKI